MTINHPMPGQSAAFGETLKHAAYLARSTRRTGKPGNIAIGGDETFGD
jgi:hypothetical protein